MKGYTYNGTISVPVVSDKEVHRRALDDARRAQANADQDLWLAGTITRDEYAARVQAGWVRFHDAMRDYISGGAQ